MDLSDIIMHVRRNPICMWLAISMYGVNLLFMLDLFYELLFYVCGVIMNYYLCWRNIGTILHIYLREWGFRGRVDSTLGTVKSPLYIEVEGYRAVVMEHMGPAVTKSWEV